MFMATTQLNTEAEMLHLTFHRLRALRHRLLRSDCIYVLYEEINIEQMVLVILVYWSVTVHTPSGN